MNKKTLCTLVHVWNCCRDMRHIFFLLGSINSSAHLKTLSKSRLWRTYFWGVRARCLFTSDYTFQLTEKQQAVIQESSAVTRECWNISPKELSFKAAATHVTNKHTCLDCGLWQWLSKQWDISITQLLLGAQTTDTWYLPSGGLFVVTDTTLCFDADAMKCPLPPSCKSSFRYRTDEVSC